MYILNDIGMVMLEKKIWIKSEKDYENEYDIEYKN